MTQEEVKVLREQNELVKELVLGIKQIVEGKTKPFN